jgi:membrane-associated phospholipid phosphatase
MKRTLLVGACALLFPLAGIAPAGYAQVSAAASAAVVQPVHFIRTDDFDFAKLLPAPPPPGSLAAAADLAAVLQAQVWRTPAQVAWARRAAAYHLFDFADVLGPWFTPDHLPRTAALLKAVDADLHMGIDDSKRTFGRPRPFLVDRRVQPCVKPTAGPSYPSGHATGFFVEAAVLAKIFPERQTALFDFAERLAWGRVLGGVHFPTDIVGGRLLAAAIVRRLDASAPFNAAVDGCRLEVARFQENRP